MVDRKHVADFHSILRSPVEGDDKAPARLGRIAVKRDDMAVCRVIRCVRHVVHKHLAGGRDEQIVDENLLACRRDLHAAHFPETLDARSAQVAHLIPKRLIVVV